MIKKLLTLSLPVLVCSLSGCAHDAAINEMVARKLPTKPLISGVLKNNIAVKKINGGHETSPIWIPKVSNQHFKSALIASLIAAKLYSPKKTSGYHLSATLLDLDQPLIGFNMTVACKVRYKLTNSKSEALYNQVISSNYTATVSDAFVGTHRLEVANARAVRVNIEKFIAALYALRLDGRVGLA